MSNWEHSGTTVSIDKQVAEQSKIMKETQITLGLKISQLSGILKETRQLVHSVGSGTISNIEIQQKFARICSAFRTVETSINCNSDTIPRGTLAKLQRDYTLILNQFHKVTKTLANNITLVANKGKPSHKTISDSTNVTTTTTSIGTTNVTTTTIDNKSLPPTIPVIDNTITKETGVFNFEKIQLQQSEMYSKDDLSQIRQLADDSKALKEIFSDLQLLIAADNEKLSVALDHSTNSLEKVNQAKDECHEAREAQKKIVAKKLPAYNAGAGSIIGGIIGCAGGPPGAMLGAAIGAGAGAATGSIWAWAANNRNASSDAATIANGLVRKRKGEFRLQVVSIVKVGQPFIVFVNVPKDLLHKNDWIGLYSGAGKPHNKFLSWRRMSTKKQESGKFKWYKKHAPTHSGRWQLRYFHSNSTNIPVTMVNFSVVDDVYTRRKKGVQTADIDKFMPS